MREQITLVQDQFKKLDKSLDTEFYGRIKGGNYSSPKVISIKHDGEDKYVIATGAMFHRLDNSSYFMFMLEPLFSYKGETKSELDGGYKDHTEALGLIVTSRKKQYVITGYCEALLDLSTLDYVEDVGIMKKLIGKQDGYWISKSELLGVYRQDGFTYCELVERSDWGDKYHYVTYVNESSKPVLKFLGDSKDFVLKVISVIESKITKAIKIKTEDVSLFSPVYTEQMSLF